MLFEASFGQGSAIDSVIKDYHRTGDVLDRQRAAHVVLSRVMFHLCYCILHHPFLLRVRLCHFSGKVYPSFLSRLLESSWTHATALCSVIQTAKDNGCNTGLATYSYCLGVCGSIHAIYTHSSNSAIASDSNTHFKHVTDCLRENARYWGVSTAIVRFYLGSGKLMANWLRQLSGLDNVVQRKPRQTEVLPRDPMRRALYWWRTAAQVGLQTRYQCKS